MVTSGSGMLIYSITDLLIRANPSLLPWCFYSRVNAFDFSHGELSAEFLRYSTFVLIFFF